MRVITETLLKEYREYLIAEEKSKATIEKYMGDLRKFQQYAGSQEVTKALVMAYKEQLVSSQRYEISSINSFLVALNRFFEFAGWYDVRVKTYKVQKAAFAPENKYLTRAEYKRLVEAAKRKGNVRLAHILNTICSTGIRISELSYITVSGVKRGKVVIHNKGKIRTILIPAKLQKALGIYIAGRHLTQGPVFCTVSGMAVDRSNVWREMKGLCKEARVDAEKIFPHNLRHLFAQCFYELKKDIAKLADVLGHNSIETTRIYIRTTCEEHRKQLEMLNLVI